MKNAFYFVVDENYVDIASAQALRLVRLWDEDVHIFVERNDKSAPIKELELDGKITYHYDVLSPALAIDAPSDEKWPKIVYLRIFAPRHLQNYTRLVYLDADIFCLRMDRFIWEVDIPHGLAAVHDFGLNGKNSPGKGYSDKTEWLESIGIYHQRYFNSGVLIIDPEKWERHDFLRLLEDFIAKYSGTMTMFDQDFMNHIFQGNWDELSPRWNFQMIAFGWDIERVFDPVFVHFTIREKPWLVNSQRDQWFYSAYDQLLEEAGFSPADYYKKDLFPVRVRVKIWVRAKLTLLGITTSKEKRLRKTAVEYKVDFQSFLDDSVKMNHFKDDIGDKIRLASPKVVFNGRVLVPDTSSNPATRGKT